jgi:ATP-dependent Clp protease adapter protein ClpS
MAPPSKDSVSRVYFTEGIYIIGTMLNSLDEKANKVAMELHPAGVMVVSAKGERHVVPYARIKSINLG